jgi:hypothetical protein
LGVKSEAASVRPSGVRKFVSVGSFRKSGVRVGGDVGGGEGERVGVLLGAAATVGVYEDVGDDGRVGEGLIVDVDVGVALGIDVMVGMCGVAVGGSGLNRI